MDGILKSNYDVRYLSILKRGLLEAFSLKARGVINFSIVALRQVRTRKGMWHSFGP